MGPDELDDLQQGDGAESKKRSALALYDGVREEDLVDEEIDERILEILGLEEVYDFTYGEYKQLLFTELQKIDRGEEKSTDRAMLLQDEFKRIKNKVGKFKVKKKKVTAENIGVTGPIKVSSNKFLLAGKAVIPEPEEKKESSGDIKEIEKLLDSILKTLTLQNNEKKKQSDAERKKLENRRRGQREGDLEKPLSQLKSLAKKIIAPAQGILDRIFRFIKFTLLGYAFNQLVKWFSDPKNADKIKVLGRFLKDWWPSLLFAYGLFATPFGKFIRVTLKMLRGFIPQIARFMTAHPLVFAGVTAALATGAAYQWKQQEDKKQIEREAKSRNVKPEVVQKEVTEARSSPIGMIGEAFSKIGPLGAFTGGGTIPIKKSSILSGSGVQKVIDINDLLLGPTGEVTEESGVKIKGAGRDTQLVAARPGEIMVTKEAVQEKGANFFLDLNRKAGGTNIPRMVNNVQLAAGGGIIKKTIKAYQGGGMIGGNKVSTPMPSFKMPGSGMSVGGMSVGGMTVQNTSLSLQGMRMGSAATPKSNKIIDEITGKGKTILNRRVEGSTSPGKLSAGIFPTDYNKPTNASYSYNKMPSLMGSGAGSSGSNRPMMIRGGGYKPSSPMPLGGSNNVINKSEPRFESPSVNPINISTQKSITEAPGKPVIISETKIIVLPPVKAPSKKTSVTKASQLPKFNISANSDSRSNIAIRLGITDLVGVMPGAI